MRNKQEIKQTNQYMYPFINSNHINLSRHRQTIFKIKSNWMNRTTLPWVRLRVYKGITGMLEIHYCSIVCTFISYFSISVL